jgi:hypothetical protein
MSFSLHRCYWVLCLSQLLLHSGQVQATPTCAANLSELRLLLADASFPLVWEETSMDDGKPLVVTILEKEGSLWLEFVKTREGLWAQSTGLICRAGLDFDTHFGPEKIRVGPAANWVMRLALVNGGKFTLTRLGANKLRISGGGWSGTFLPYAK